MKQIQPGMHMKGHYYGAQFTGVVRHVRCHTANWRNVCVSLTLDEPIQTPSDKRADIYIEVRPDGYDVTGHSFIEHDVDYIDYSADADSGDASRITPDPCEPDYDEPERCWHCGGHGVVEYGPYGLIECSHCHGYGYEPAPEPERPVDVLRTAHTYRAVMARLYGTYSAKAQRAAAVFESLFTARNVRFA